MYSAAFCNKGTINYSVLHRQTSFKYSSSTKELVEANAFIDTPLSNMSTDSDALAKEERKWMKKA